MGLVPEPAAPVHPNKATHCGYCHVELGDDIFCGWHGTIDDLWLCDSCVHSNRGKGMNGIVAHALTKKFMDEHAVRIQLGTVQSCIENLAEIKWIEGHDGAGSHRSVDLNLTFHESRPIYRALYEVLKKRLNENESFPA